MNLSKNVKITKVLAAAATGVTALNSASVDMASFDGVVFFGRLAVANAGNFGNLAQSSDDVTFNDLAGTKVSPGDNEDSFAIDVYKPTKRFVRCEIDRSGITTITGDVYAIQYRASKAPTSHGATVDAETHISPAEGTA